MWTAYEPMTPGPHGVQAVSVGWEKGWEGLLATLILSRAEDVKLTGLNLVSCYS